jgi:hypothetical protein
MFQMFQDMFQVFYIDVVKVDQDIVYVAIGYTRMFQVYVPNVLDVASVSFDVKIVDLNVAYIYASVSDVFICMLQVFHLDVYNECFKVFFRCFRHIFQVFHLSFRRMLQVLHLNVSKINGVLSLVSLFATSSRCLFLLTLARHLPPPPPFSKLVTFGATRVPRGRVKRAGDCRRVVRTSGHASSIF